MSGLRVLASGLMTTVQDRGRIGHSSIGIGRAGPCDRAALTLANRLVGNDEDRAGLEVTFGGLHVRAEGTVVVALTGARCPGLPHNAVFTLSPGKDLRLAPPVSGLRTYLAVRGGVDVPPVLGSRSTDTLAGLGPPALRPGDLLPVGPPPPTFPTVDQAPVAEPEPGRVDVAVSAGPRASWVGVDGWRRLAEAEFEVSADSNRVGLRLDGPTLPRARDGELPSEGMLPGAVQLPPSGTPVLFLADHPVTGGYPVIAYVADHDVDRCAQLRPGQRLRMRPLDGPEATHLPRR